MEVVKTPGVVLRSIPFNDNATIVHFYTRQQGLVSCMVHHGKKQGNKSHGALLQNLALNDLVLTHGNTSDLFHLKEIKPYYNYQTINNLQNNINKVCILMFLNEFLVKCIREGVHSTSLYDFLSEALMTFDKSEKFLPDFHIIFLMHLARYIGFGFPKPTSNVYNVYDIQQNTWSTQVPDNPYYIPKPYLEFILEASNAGFSDSIRNCNNGAARRTTTEYIISYYRYHFPELGTIKSLDILSTLMM